MFTGIIEDLGTVEEVKRTDRGALLSFVTALPLNRIAIGESIAVNGACLTVIRKRRSARSAAIAMEVSAETLRRTTLGTLEAGDRVNLERCLSLDKLIGGHLVSGHVDGVGRIVAIAREGASMLYTFEVAPAQARYLVEKGSVAIDGVSLTVFGIRGRRFAVALIPHTLKMTTLGRKRIGDAVNIESDMLVKYVERILAGRRSEGASRMAWAPASAAPAAIAPALKTAGPARRARGRRA
ncbi:MAG TPA: riboflavin synthase [Candidatus Binataceae bacterium]|nr:riboflavin synthase [Candidatus Binataceae bacterium]